MPRKRQPASIDGALVIDKPGGPTSHDVVEAVRRALGRFAQMPPAYSAKKIQGTPAQIGRAHV